MNQKNETGLGGSAILACGVTGVIVAWKLIAAITSTDAMAIHDFIASIPKYLVLGVVIFALSAAGRKKNARKQET